MKKQYISAIILLAAAIGIIVWINPIYKSMYHMEFIKKGPGVTEIKRLSDYFSGLKNTPGDSDVYILDSKKPGGTIFIAGGTHPNEPAGHLSAIFYIENAIPVAGRVIVVPYSNASAATHTDAMEGSPQKFYIQTPNGKRMFRYASRATNPVHQWPDPDVYIHASSGQKLSGSEVRNLNRAHPGRPDGNLTEKTAYAIVEMIKKENATISIDLHEASPEYPVINAIVAHQRAMDLAAEVTFNLLSDGIIIGLEQSPVKLRGLSHREWGDHTQTLAILMETANPAQGRIRGATNARLVVEGTDKMYAKVAPYGKLFVPFTEEGQPLSERVARHVTAVNEIMKVYTANNPDNPIVVESIPDYMSIKTDMGNYFTP